MKYLTSLINKKNLVIIILIITAITLLQTVYKTSVNKISDKTTVIEWIDSDALIIDIRTPEEYAAGHYSGSINIPLADIAKDLQKFGRKDGKIIVYCRSGNRSGKAKIFLEKQGFKNVINGGGLKDMP